jgi:hypothetical protein
MAYEGNGFYHNYFINDKEVSWGPADVTDTLFQESIFWLYPSVEFTLQNVFNNVYQQGLVKEENTIRIELGRSVDDANKTIIDNIYIEKYLLGSKASDFSGGIDVTATSKFKKQLSKSSPAKGWEALTTSGVIQSIISNRNIPVGELESTIGLGNWLKPSAQSEADFLQILRNRSLPQLSKPSKMFMWIGLDGKFYFKSLSGMLAQAPVDELDFTIEEMQVYIPGEFRLENTSVCYTDECNSSGISQYDLNGELKKLSYPQYGKTNGTISQSIEELHPLESSHSILYEYQHSLLPNDYTKAMYYNNYMNFPYQLSFTIKSSPKIALGAMIRINFTHHSSEEGVDKSISGNYLITSICKKERGNNFMVDIGCISNSVLVPLTKF